MTIAFDARVRPTRGSAEFLMPARHQVRPSTQVVLTARGRIVLGLLMALMIGLGVVFLGSTVAATQDAAALPTETVLVQPGDSLWSVAAEANPGGDIRKTINEIVRLNALESGSSLPAGLTLSVPIYE